MFLKSLHLINFKNCSESTFQLSPKVNCFLGENGEGKTNILDAIYYLSYCKSYFNLADSQNIKHGEAFFVIQGLYDLNSEELEIYCGLKKGNKKAFKKNKKEYLRLSDHIGLLPLVMISPSDSNLISEGSETRRKFIDSIISQFDKQYLEELIQYNKALIHRNALLKQFAEGMPFNAELLYLWDLKLIEPGNYIFKKRQAFLSEFVQLFSTYFKIISNGKEEVGIEYKSELIEHNFEELLKNNQSRDRKAQLSLSGIHKDDVLFTLGEFPIKKIGSQGQQKSFLIALKLAQYYYLAQIKKYPPILLLDDIFDKLDETRVQRLMQLVTNPEFGQVFITDTGTQKLPQMLTEIGVDHVSMQISSGLSVNQAV